jgi:hypothetical protein
MKYTDHFKEIVANLKKVDVEKVKSVDPTELSLGQKEEMEHVKDPKMARIIALQHLVGTENNPGDPQYYTKLKNASIDEDDCCGTTDGDESGDRVLDVPNRVNGISMSKIIQVGKSFGQPVAQASLGVKPETDKEPIHAAGKVDSSVATKTVGGQVVPGEGQKVQGGNNFKGTIEKTPKNPTIGEASIKGLKKEIKDMIRECLKENYGAYKVGGLSARTFDDSPQFPQSSVFNPEITEKSSYNDSLSGQLDVLIKDMVSNKKPTDTPEAIIDSIIVFAEDNLGMVGNRIIDYVDGKVNDLWAVPSEKQVTENFRKKYFSK